MGVFDFIKKNNDKEEDVLAGLALPQEIYDASALALEDVIAPSAINITPREMNMSGTLVRTFFAVAFPRYLTDGWLEPILNLEKVFDVSITIHPMDTTEVLEEIPEKSCRGAESDKCPGRKGACARSTT